MFTISFAISWHLVKNFFLVEEFYYPVLSFVWISKKKVTVRYWKPNISKVYEKKNTAKKHKKKKKESAIVIIMAIYRERLSPEVLGWLIVTLFLVSSFLILLFRNEKWRERRKKERYLRWLPDIDHVTIGHNVYPHGEPVTPHIPQTIDFHFSYPSPFFASIP